MIVGASVEHFVSKFKGYYSVVMSSQLFDLLKVLQIVNPYSAVIACRVKQSVVNFEFENPATDAFDDFNWLEFLHKVEGTTPGTNLERS